MAPADDAVNRVSKYFETFDPDTANPTEVFEQLNILLNRGQLQTLVPVLPFILRLDGKPYSLVDHFPFEDLFRFRLPTELVYMTGRQVAKSTSLASSGVVRSGSIANFRTLYVTPLYEQIRRFSTNYVQPFINQSPIKAIWKSKGTKNSVLHQSFYNNSQILFSYALLNADRVRGISADFVGFDESFKSNTIIDLRRNEEKLRVQIKDVRPGDILTSFDSRGKLLESVVENVSYHGVRGCFRLTTRSGKTIDATAESWVATDQGWRRVSQVVEQAYCRVSRLGEAAHGELSENVISAATYVGAGNEPWRWLSRVDGSACGLPQQSRMEAGGIQLDQVPDLVRVRFSTTREDEEWRLRRMVELLLDCAGTGLRLLVRAALPERQEDDHRGAASDDRRRGLLADDGLVVGGRRQSLGRYADLSHGGIQPQGSAPALRLVDRARLPEHAPSDQDLLHGTPAGASDAGLDRSTGAVRSASDAVQAQSATATDGAGLSLLRQRVLSETAAEDCFQATMLPECGVPASADAGDQTSVGQQRISSAKQKRQGARKVSQQHRGSAGGGSCGCRGAEAAQPGERQGSEATLLAEAARGTQTAYVDLPAMRTDGAAGRPRLPYEILRPVPDAGDATDQAAIGDEMLVADDLVSIEYIGEHDVYDLEVSGTRTFIANGIAVHNCQDMVRDHIPIIREVMSHSKWNITQYTGTPKTEDNTLTGLWKLSSQAEWFIPCTHCTTNGFSTWNIPSREFHLEKMIGPYRDDISEARPAVICHKCGQSLYPKLGRWVHRKPEMRWKREGRHIPQIIMPIHYADPEKWSILLAKQEGVGNITTAQFYNEVMGEPCDVAAKLVVEGELRRVANLGPNTLESLMRRRNMYRTLVLAVDWGGGGEKGVSFTTAAFVGITPTGKIEVPYGKRLLTPHDHLLEAKEILHLWRTVRPNLLAHDYTGAGALRETFMVQAGIPLNRIMPCMYVRSASHRPCYHVKATYEHPRDHYRVDKSRTLLYTCAVIKQQQLRFFNWDYVSMDNRGLIYDFLSLIEEKSQTLSAGEIYRIDRTEDGIDDFAQAVNIGCVALWHRHGWPNIAMPAQADLTEEQIRAAAPQHAWQEEEK